MRTPWIKHTLPDFVQSYERKADIVTWEMVPEPNRTIAEKLACLKTAVTYIKERGFEIVQSFSFSFQVADPEDEIDDKVIADMVYLETGVRTEWYPYRVGDTDVQASTTEAPPSAAEVQASATEVPSATEVQASVTKPPSATEVPSAIEARPNATKVPSATEAPPSATEARPSATEAPSAIEAPPSTTEI